MIRPRLAPVPTTPRKRYGRPSSRAAAVTSPASNAVRTRLLDTTAQSIDCRPTTAKRICLAAGTNSPSSSRSPARPRPKRKLNPSTTALAAEPFAQNQVEKLAGL